MADWQISDYQVQEVKVLLYELIRNKNINPFG